MPDVSNPTREQVRHGHTEYSEAQQEWLGNMLDSIGSDQKIVVFNHIALNGIATDQWAADSIADAEGWFENTSIKSYQPGIQSSHNIYTLLSNYQDSHNNILGFFAGHVHRDDNAFSGGIQYVTTTCGLADRGAGKDSRTIGDLSENGWEVIQINPSRNQINQYRLPGGYADENGFKQSWQL